MYAVSCCASLVGPGGPRRSAERAFSVPFSRARHGVTCKCKCEHLNEATRSDAPKRWYTFTLKMTKLARRPRDALAAPALRRRRVAALYADGH